MNIFKEKIQILKPGSSKFDLSHERKMSVDMGKLIPCFVQEILPGDRFKVDTSLMVRVAPMLAPLYHKLDVYTHFFYVPNRIIWNEWEAFITGGNDGLQAPVHPAFNLFNANTPELFSNGSLLDYMGLPTDSPGATITSTELINALPFRAYAEIYNEYYRDENLITKIPYSKGSGIMSIPNADIAQLLTMRTRAWEKDYFTTALPFAQRGPAGAAPVEPGTTPTKTLNSGTGLPVPTLPLAGGATGDLGDGAQQIILDNQASVLITELRKAAKLQEFLEAAARGGARLTEWILHVFGVQSSDARLQRPEYLGGGKTPITISEVLSNFQFSGDLEGKPQGNMAGHGIAVGSTHGFSRTFEEHGFVIGIMSIIPRANYYQNLERMWQRPTRFDYYIPQFAHLGEQEVKNKEIFWKPTAPVVDPTANDTFGYQSRYADYKFKLSTIHGEFRDSLAYWHMARKFSATPGLNQTFVECDPTTDIFAVPSEPSFFVQLWHDVSAIRPLPYFSNPKL